MHDLKMTDWKMTDNADRNDVASCCCGARSWTAVLLLLVDVDAVVDAVVVVVVADLSEKPGTVYPKAVAYGAQKLKLRVCRGIIARDACLDAGVILKISLFLWSTYSNAAVSGSAKSAVLSTGTFCRCVKKLNKFGWLT